MQSLWMLLASFFLTLMAACAKWGASDYGTFALLFYRSGVGFIAIAVWMAFTSKDFRTKFLGGHILRSIAGSLGVFCWFWAIGRMPLETTMTLNYTSPLFMALTVAVISSRKGIPVDKRMIAAIVLGFAGALLVLRPTSEGTALIPAAVALFSAMLACAAYLQIRQLSALNEPAWRIVFYFTLFGTLTGAAGALLAEPQGLAVVPTVRVVSAILGLGLFGLFAQLSLTKAFGGGNLLLTAVFQFSAIAFAAGAGWLFFGDEITWVSALGILVIIFAGASAAVFTKQGWKAIDAADRKAQG